MEWGTFDDRTVVRAWDPQRRLGEAYRQTLNLKSMPWDVYLLHARGVTWEGDGPPPPTFWMHQLPTNAGADPALVLNASRLLEETVRLVGSDIGASRPDLGLMLHGKGLMNLTRDRPQYTLEDVYGALEESPKCSC